MKYLPVLFLLAGPALAQNPSPAPPAQTDTLVYNARRAVTLAGGSNFRDLGGYPAAGGKRVRWRRLYRSADISQLTDDDLSALSQRHVAVVCDLRGPQEYRDAPDRLPPGARRVELPAGSEKVDLRQLGQQMRNPRFNGDSLLRASYANIAPFKAKYGPLFEQLLTLDDAQALLFHCTAGKDRTGIGAALVLAALGVNRDVILRDYAATNVYLQPARTPAGAALASASPAAEAKMRPLRAANPAYLALTFATIEQQYGSVDNYLTQVMELTPAKRTRLRAKYLQ